MSFWGAHEFRHNTKNRPPKKIPHEDCTAGIKVTVLISEVWFKRKGGEDLERNDEFV